MALFPSPHEVGLSLGWSDTRLCISGPPHPAELPKDIPYQPWGLRDLASARRRELVEREDGSFEARVDHEPVPGVTVPMILWWFQEGVVGRAVNPGDGKEYDAYQVWHPYDHVSIDYRYAKGGRGPGSRRGPSKLSTPEGRSSSLGSRGAKSDGRRDLPIIHLREFMGAQKYRGPGPFGLDPAYRQAKDLSWIDTTITTTKLDDTGTTCIVRVPALAGTVFCLEHVWWETSQGLGVRSTLRLGRWGMGLRNQWVNAWVRRLGLSAEDGSRWIRHCIEEMGNLEHFLPAVYARATSL